MYEFKSISIQNINRNGTALAPALTFTPSTVPALISEFAVGNRVRLTVLIENTTGNITDEEFALQLSLFGNPQQPNYLSGTSSGQISNFNGKFFGGVPSISFSSPEPSARNSETFTYSAPNPNEIEVIVDFYITLDRLGWIQAAFVQNNRDRLMSASATQTNGDTSNIGGVVFSQLSFLGIAFYVISPPPVSQATPATDPNTGLFAMYLPFKARWYNSDYDAVTTSRRYIQQLQISSPLQIAAGLPLLTNANATAPQAPFAPADSIFTITNLNNIANGGQQLSQSETNTVNIRLQGFSHSGLSVSTISAIRVLLIRVEPFSGGQSQANTVYFEDYYDLAEGIVPASEAGNTLINKALRTPSSWTQNGTTGQIDLQFRIDGNLLSLNSEYRIIVNIYETAEPTRHTSHISPALFTTFVPTPVPNIDPYMGTYRREYNANELTDVSPHNRIKCRLEVDKADFDAQLAALGFSGNFDDALVFVTATLQGITGLAATVEEYKPNTLTPPANNQVLSANMEIVADTATLLNIAATFRIEEERANTTATVRWVFRFRLPDIYEITYLQTIDVIDFENDIAPPRLVAVRFLDADMYPAVKMDVTDFCGREFVVCEVERDSVLLAGSVGFIACIYPASVTGDTTNAQIEEEESWQPATPVIPQLFSPKIELPTPNFIGDFAWFLIPTSQLVIAQQYFVTGIALQQFPDYCPIGLTTDTLIGTLRTGTIAPGWAITVDYNGFINDIVAHPDYIGASLVIVQQDILLPDNTQLVTISAGVGLYAAQTINSFYPLADVAYVQIVIDAVFDSGSGNHLVRHTLRVEVPRPPVNAGVFNYDSNDYQCQDLGDI